MMYYEAGFVKVHPDGSDLFYWLFRSRGAKDTDPLVFWLSGGPGCSSELAVFYENGPFHIKKEGLFDFKLIKNDFSWNTNANVVYMDQPVGTGFSRNKHITDLDWNEEKIAKDFYTFLLGFMAKHPEYKSRSMFITGESYAGHYIPVVAAYIVRQNNSDVSLIGAGIGNGLVDPYNQYPEYVTFAEENHLEGKVIGTFDKAAMVLCQELILNHWKLPNVLSKLLAMEEC